MVDKNDDDDVRAVMVRQVTQAFLTLSRTVPLQYSGIVV
jgi:hypothetical protein